MANYCYYSMKVEGAPDNIREFIEVLSRRDGEPGRHFYRIFDIDIDEEETIEDGYVKINGNCAWSVYTAMMGVDPYDHGFHIENYNKRMDALAPLALKTDMVSRHNLIYLRNKIEEETPQSTLIRESKLLNLTIEVFSEENGMSFQEHYVVKNGELLVDEHEETQVYGTDEFDTVEEFNECYGLNVSKEDFDINDDITIGGYYPWTFGQYKENQVEK